MWYVTHQRYWHDTEPHRTCIEIGFGEPGPGMLASTPYLETDVKHEAWKFALEQHDKTGYIITRGNTMVYGNPDDPEDIVELRKELAAMLINAPRCEYCGSMEGVSQYTNVEFDDYAMACCEYHAELLFEPYYEDEEDEDEV